MPFRRRPPNTRRRFRRRRPYGRLNRYGKIGSMSRFRSNQSQTYKTFWFNDSGTVPASVGNGVISQRFGANRLILIEAFKSASYLYEQYRVIRIVLTLYPSGNSSAGRYNTFHRGSICSFIDVPPYNQVPPTSIKDLINNSSTRIHYTRSRIKRYIYRPMEQYNSWAPILRVQGTTLQLPILLWIHGVLVSVYLVKILMNQHLKHHLFQSLKTLITLTTIINYHSLFK